MSSLLPARTREARASAVVGALKTKQELAELDPDQHIDADEDNDSEFEADENGDIADGGKKTNESNKKTKKRKSKSTSILELSDDENEREGGDNDTSTINTSSASASATVTALGGRGSKGNSNSKGSLTDAASAAKRTATDAVRKRRAQEQWSEIGRGIGGSGLGTGGKKSKGMGDIGALLNRLNNPVKKRKKPVLDKAVARMLASTRKKGFAGDSNSGSSCNKTTSAEAQARIRLAAQAALKSTGTVKISREVQFAGQKIKVTHVVDKGSKDKHVEALRAEAARQQSTSALDKLMGNITKRAGVSTIEKSSYDWQNYKADNNLVGGELERKAQDGYIDKQDFLGRVDQRQFHKEKRQRDLERAKRAAAAATGGGSASAGQ